MDVDDSLTVLIVDDDRTTAESYELYLQDVCEVKLAENGGEALVELGPDVDVVLLDRRMPGMTGDEVLEHVRDWDMECRVIMVSAVDPDLDVIEMDIDEYLTKPVSREDLVAAVEQVVLLDRYEQLVSEYHAVVKKLATLKSHLPGHKVGGSDEIAALEDRRDDLRTEIGETIDQFADEEMVAVLEESHDV